MTPDQFKNVIAFCALMSGESCEVLHQSPEYIIEKYYRYIGVDPSDDERWNLGHHPGLRRFVRAYFTFWALDEDGMMALLTREASESKEINHGQR